MKSQEIYEITLQAPNKPFTLRLADGRAIRVPTRDHVAFRRGSRAIFAWDSKGKPHFLDAGLVTGISGIDPLTKE
jgi:hypothetical protein